LATLSINNLYFQQRGPFNLRIESEQTVSLTGPSGAGKSLLLRAIADLDPHQGDCAIDDKICSGMPAPQWRRQVGLLPAKTVWWFDTVGEHFANREPRWLANLGFDTDVMHWTVSRLSTGEQQRLALLRLLQNQPQVLLLDEPTASLDAENTQRMEQLIAEYRSAQHCAIFWVTHAPQQATRVAQRHLVIKDNQLHELET
jgi:ABC-type iron transport system FetAB ATPase subunit